MFYPTTGFSLSSSLDPALELLLDNMRREIRENPTPAPPQDPAPAQDPAPPDSSMASKAKKDESEMEEPFRVGTMKGRRVAHQSRDKGQSGNTKGKSSNGSKFRVANFVKNPPLQQRKKKIRQGSMESAKTPSSRQKSESNVEAETAAKSTGRENASSQTTRVKKNMVSSPSCSSSSAIEAKAAPSTSSSIAEKLVHKIPEDVIKLPFKQVVEAKAPMTCYCQLCGKMQYGHQPMAQHYEKQHGVTLNDETLILCLSEDGKNKAEGDVVETGDGHHDSSEEEVLSDAYSLTIDFDAESNQGSEQGDPDDAIVTMPVAFLLPTCSVVLHRCDSNIIGKCNLLYVSLLLIC